MAMFINLCFNVSLLPMSKEAHFINANSLERIPKW